jgi:hypothetical protein
MTDKKDERSADAGEPNTRPKCSHTRLVKDRCPICGPLDDDNRPVTDGDTPAPSAAAAIRGEPSCCYLIRTDKGLWRPKAAGYTSNPAEAGRYTYEDAARHTRSLGPEKHAEIIHERDAPAYERPCCARTREEGLAEAFERAAQDCRGKAADFHALGDDRAVRSFVGLADLYEGFVKKARRTDGDTP